MSDVENDEKELSKVNYWKKLNNDIKKNINKIYFNSV